MSYAVQSDESGSDNEMTLYDANGLMLCHGATFFRGGPAACSLPYEDAAATSKASSRLANVADGKWHHVAATWTAADNGCALVNS